MPQTIEVRANDIDFSALTWGEPGGPLALLLHGYPDTAWTWRHLGPELASDGWYAVAPFTRGYAPTSTAPSDRYLAADLADDVVALHHVLSGDERAALIGHDWGAVTVWAVAGRQPNLFRRHVALSVPPAGALLSRFEPSRWAVLPRQVRMSWYMFYNQLPLAERGLDRVIPRLWRDWSPGYDATEDLWHVFEALGALANRRAALRYYRNNLGPGARALFTTRPRAAALYLHGSGDGCMGEAVARAGAKLLAPGSSMEVVPGLGHFLHLEDPVTVNRRIIDWLG